MIIDVSTLIVVLVAIFFICLLNIIYFLIGVKTAQKVLKNEEIKLPNINPIEMIKEHRERKEAEIEQSKFDIMLENINNYKGDSTGQKDLPR